MRRKKKQVIRLSITVASIIAVFSAWIYFTYLPEDTLLQPFQLSSGGYVTADVGLVGSTLYLSVDCYQLAMEISTTQALSIKNGIEGRVDTRPLTHDIMTDILDNFGIDVLAARIESFESGIYYARIIARQGNKILDIDSRPSDAVAVALRSGIPVYVREELIRYYGENICRTRE